MTNNNLQIIKRFIDKCNEFEDCKFLFLDKKITELLEVVVQTKEIYELISECMDNFNKEKEYDKAFVTGSNGNNHFIEPKEEYKVIALDFCILVDIANGKRSVDFFISKYFKSDEDKKSYEVFIEKVIYSFRNLICEAFGVTNAAMNYISNTSGEEIEEKKDEIDSLMKATVDKISNKLQENVDLTEVFLNAKDIAMEILDNLSRERVNEFTVDAEKICKSLVACSLNNDFDAVYGLALGLKHISKNIKSIRFLTRELVVLLQDQIDWAK